MSSEKEQNTQNNQEKSVDYHDLFDSLVKESEKNQALEENSFENKDATNENKAGVSSVLHQEQDKSYAVPLLKSLRKQPLSHTYSKARPRQPVTERTDDSNQGKFYQLVCPYCGKKIGFFRTWMLKNKGDYFCDVCGNHSIILINKIVVPMAIVTVIISVFLVLLFTFLVDMQIWSIILVFIPFLIFFCASIFTVRLKKISPAGKKRRKKSVNYNETHTRIL